jgi:hypothetical protein
MTVVLEPTPSHTALPPGFKAAGLHCGLKKNQQFDLGLLLADQPVEAAAIYTQNQLVGAHIHVCRDHLRSSGGLVRAGARQRAQRQLRDRTAGHRRRPHDAAANWPTTRLPRVSRC